MDYTKSQLNCTVIRAPVTGTILERTAEKGELVTAQFASGAEGGPRGSVVALADLNDIQVELDIAQDDFAKLSPHQEGIVTLDAFKDRSYKGEIAEMSPEANRQKATVQVKVQILQPDSYLRPEMNATVQFKYRHLTKRTGAFRSNRTSSFRQQPCATRTAPSSSSSHSTARRSVATCTSRESVRVATWSTLLWAERMSSRPGRQI